MAQAEQAAQEQIDRAMGMVDRASDLIENGVNPVSYTHLDVYKRQASCWVRVAQLWAGNGYGTMFMPRIGMEVVVDFLEGNPDPVSYTHLDVYKRQHPSRAQAQGVAGRTRDRPKPCAGRDRPARAHLARQLGRPGQAQGGVLAGGYFGRG